MAEEVEVPQPKKVVPKSDEEILKQMQQAQAQVINEEQKKFLDALNNLIFNVQELSYALALVEGDESKYSEEIKELINAARDVIRSAYQFHKLVKKGVAKQ